MIKILFNKKSTVESKLTIKIDKFKVEASIQDEKDDKHRAGSDTITELASYNSYAFSSCPNGQVKTNNKVHSSDYKFLNLNRLGVAIKMDFANVSQLFADYDVFQLDTGIISDTERDIVIRVFSGKEENTEIITDEPYVKEYFDSGKLKPGEHPRFELWDSYSLTCNNTEWKATNKGNFVEEPKTKYIPYAKDYVNFKIQKYKGNFKEPLMRDIDNETVLIESSAGFVNNRRVKLKNGVGYFRFYPFGADGEVKIKIGRKWYEVWNEYNLIME